MVSMILAMATASAHQCRVRQLDGVQLLLHFWRPLLHEALNVRHCVADVHMTAWPCLQSSLACLKQNNNCCCFCTRFRGAETVLEHVAPIDGTLPAGKEALTLGAWVLRNHHNRMRAGNTQIGRKGYMKVYTRCVLHLS